MRRVLTIGMLSVLAACSGISVNQDFVPGIDFQAYQTYAWMPNQGETSGSNPMANQRIRSAIEGQLREDGFREITSGEPDFYVGYHLILDEEVDYTTYNDYWGAGWSYRGFYGPGMTTSRTTAVRYTVGTLVIDFFDAEERSLAWRGTAEGQIHETSNPRERQARADEAVAKILSQFPPRG